MNDWNSKLWVATATYISSKKLHRCLATLQKNIRKIEVDFLAKKCSNICISNDPRTLKIAKVSCQNPMSKKKKKIQGNWKLDVIIEMGHFLMIFRLKKEVKIVPFWRDFQVPVKLMIFEKWLSLDESFAKINLNYEVPWKMCLGFTSYQLLDEWTIA